MYRGVLVLKQAWIDNIPNYATGTRTLVCLYDRWAVLTIRFNMIHPESINNNGPLHCLQGRTVVHQRPWMTNSRCDNSGSVCQWGGGESHESVLAENPSSTRLCHDHTSLPLMLTPSPAGTIRPYMPARPYPLPSLPPKPDSAPAE